MEDSGIRPQKHLFCHKEGTCPVHDQEGLKREYWGAGLGGGVARVNVYGPANASPDRGTG